MSFIDLEENSYRNIWRISWPLMLSFLTYTLLITADMFWIGRLGPAYVAAVAVVGSIYWVLYSFEGLISSGTVAVVSRAAGSENEEMLYRGLSMSIIISLFIGILLSIISIFLTEDILGLFGVAPKVLNLGIPYMKVFFIGLIFMISHSTIFSAFYALGDSRIPMIISISSIVLNIILDPFLIFGWGVFPRLGITGAAVASVISQFFKFILAIFVFIKRVDFKRFMMDKEMFISFLKIGFPALLHTLNRPITSMVIYRIVAFFGTFTLAAFGIGIRVIHYMFIYMDGLMIATQTMVGQYLGRGNRVKARQICFRTLSLGFIIQGISTLLVFFQAENIISIFNSNLSVVEQGAMYLRIIVISLLFYPLIASFGAAHRGSGDTRPQMVSSLVSNWAIKVPLSLLFSIVMGMNSTGIWIAIAISVIFEAIILTFFFLRGGWMGYRISE